MLVGGNIFMVAYDPATDFALGLAHPAGAELTLGEAVGGKYVFVPKARRTSSSTDTSYH